MLGKSRLKSVLFGYEVRSTAIISNGIVHSTPRQKTLGLLKKELEKLTKYANLSPSETNRLWQQNYSRCIRVAKGTYSLLRQAKKTVVIRAGADLEYDEELKLRKNVVYSVVRKEFPLLEKEKNEAADEYEYRAKRENLQSLFGSGVFYLCSSHQKPAKDHAEWEGKIYVHEDWAMRIDEEMHGKVEAYIRNHHIRTVQWVTGSPVWLVYRPNCKHYFIEVSIEEVLGSSVRKLLKAHNMYMEDEKEETYEYGQYKHYYERLKVYSYLHSMFDAEDLDKDITETRKLVRKWKLLSEGSGYRSGLVNRAITSREAA